MKRLVVPALLLPLLVGCTQIYRPIPRPSYPKTGIQDIDAFVTSLCNLTDHPNKATVKSTMEYNYMMGSSDGEYLTMHASDDFTIERFLLNKKDGITVREGTYTVEDDPSRYVAQTYHDEENFYLLTNYKSITDVDTKQTAPYTEDTLETNLSINFRHKEIENLIYLSKFENDEDVLGEYTLPEEIPADGEVSYKYALTIYEQGYLNQKVIHEVTFTLENNVVVSSTQIVENDLFGGTRQKINYSVNVAEIAYEQGEYKEFTDTLFDPDDFVEVER